MMKDIKQLKKAGDHYELKKPVIRILAIFIAVILGCGIIIDGILLSTNIFFSSDSQGYDVFRNFGIPLIAIFIVSIFCVSILWVASKPVIFDVQQRVIIFSPWTKVSMNEFLGFSVNYFTRNGGFELSMRFNSQGKEKQYVLKTYITLGSSALNGQMYSLRREIEELFRFVGIGNTSKEEF